VVEPPKKIKKPVRKPKPARQPRKRRTKPETKTTVEKVPDPPENREKKPLIVPVLLGGMLLLGFLMFMKGGKKK
jgi:hypothetical protein